MKISTLEHFEDFLKTRIPTRDALFMGDIGLKRAKYFMRLLGNPQNKVKVIHIAGTSGKGSTAHLISHILNSQGFKTGLSISPHFFDIRERMQVNNKLLDEKLFISHFNQILPVILKMEKCKYGMPTFFEICVGFAYYIFAKEKIDYAIVETGLGGTLDGTNTVANKNKICILTKMGIDHSEILGKTIEKITQQKAGIIQKNNIVISHQSSTIAANVIKKRCAEQNSKLYLLNKKNFKLISSLKDRTFFDFLLEKLKLEKIRLGLIGQHQAENCSLALACLLILSKRDNFIIKEKDLRETLKKIKIPGRMQIIKNNKGQIILDGAHNAQKMQTFINSLSKIYPEKKFIFILAFKKGKDFKKMLEAILPLAFEIYLFEFSINDQDNHTSSIDNEQISKFLLSKNYCNFKILANNDELKTFFEKQQKKPVIITGSLYFIASFKSKTFFKSIF